MDIGITYATTNGLATETGPLMHAMVDTYYTDMIPFAHLSLIEIFDRIKAIPYRNDPPHQETLMRPYYTMYSHGWGGDCDDKAIALASWAKIVLSPDPETGKSYRFIAVRKEGASGLHHVYTELFVNGRYLIADATYKFNVLGRLREPYAEYVII